jgi:hypothetical protein
MRAWLFVVALASCAGPAANYGRGPQAVARWDFAYEHAPAGSFKDEARRERDTAATAWIREQLREASSTDPTRAFGIVTTLHREALARQLEALDRNEIQPALVRTVIGCCHPQTLG